MIYKPYHFVVSPQNRSLKKMCEYGECNSKCGTKVFAASFYLDYTEVAV
jgi:hypothetical protein